MCQEYAAGGIVVKDPEGDIMVLLIKDRYGRWIWPKGHMEEGESPHQTALREISEETGLKGLHILSDIGEQEYFFTRDGKTIHKTVYLFLVKASGDEKIVPQASEIDEVKWFSPPEALEIIGYDGSRGFLERGLSDLIGKYRT